jgi:two-component system response regulator YesN
MDRLLVVDDEEMACEGMRRTLSRQGLFDVLVAHSGVEALELIRRETISAMLLDIEMPDMNGIELMHALEREGHRPLIIIVSGYEKFDYARQALNYGATDYVLKPVDSLDVMEIGRKLHGLLEERRGREAHVEKLRAFVHEHLDIIRQKLLYDILNSQVVPVSLEEIRATYGIDLSGSHFMAAIVLIRRADERLDEVEFQVALKLVEDILNELVLRESGFNLFNMENARYVLLVNSDGPIDRHRIDALTEELMRRVRDVPGIECYVGVGDEARALSGIASSYNNATTRSTTARSLAPVSFTTSATTARKRARWRWTASASRWTPRCGRCATTKRRSCWASSSTILSAARPPSRPIRPIFTRQNASCCWWASSQKTP